MSILIKDTNLTFEREPLRSPYGFKGGSLSELWQISAMLEAEGGDRAVGPGVQSVLWSDSAVFAGHSESGGNALMLAMTDFALRLVKGRSFKTPFELLDMVFPEVLEYGRRITGRKDLRATFALNALVPVDLAAWILFARRRGTENFDEVLPEEYRSALGHRHHTITKVPTVGYQTSVDEIVGLLRDGSFFPKIKLGADPEGDGDQEKMLAWDCGRMSEIHERLREVPCPSMADGRIPYYLDANGRYETKERLLRLLDHCEKIGALERIQLLEEPFPETFLEDVSDIPVRLVADESAHTEEDAIVRMELGYGAIALKPIAKTMSSALRVAKAAFERGVPCFCADLTVNPLMVEWNKVVAARLAPIPGFEIGVLETNGPQNYLNWERMKSLQPLAGESWIRAEGGEFPLPGEFYETSGGIFRG